VSKDADSSLVSNIKTSVKYFHLAVGLRSDTSHQKWPKTSHLRRHSQKKWNPKPKIFFHCRLEDLPSLLRVWTAL